METKYIGLVEYNDNEGEQFGYYIEQTPENIELLKSVEQKYKDVFCDEDGDCNYDNTMSFEYDAYTSHELDLIEYGACNCYLNRCNILEGSYRAKLKLFVNELCDTEGKAFPIYKGSFFLKNGDEVDLLDTEIFEEENETS